MHSSLQTPISAQDRAYQHVKSEILSYSLKPGQWLKAQDIARVVSVSRTPVREALCRLEQEGFVRRDGGWGYVVESITIQAARDIYKVREILEAEAAKEAAGKISPTDIEVLDRLLRKAAGACAKGQIRTFRTNTRAFHSTISRIANNALLARMLAQLQERVQQLGAMVFEKHPSRMTEVIEENRAILAALKSGKAGRAEAEARRHVQRAWESYRRYVLESQ